MSKKRRGYRMAHGNVGNPGAGYSGAFVKEDHPL